jgi:predicted aspartyl protease
MAKKGSKQASTAERAQYAIRQFEDNNIEFSLKNEASGHFHCRRKSDDKLIQFWAGTGKILGHDDSHGIHSLIELLIAG